MNEKAKTRIDEILHSISDLLGVPVDYHPLQEDQGRVIPSYNVNAIISKFIALMVFNGLTVPTSFPPTYNCVHADIEWWKQQVEKLESEGT